MGWGDFWAFWRLDLRRSFAHWRTTDSGFSLAAAVLVFLVTIGVADVPVINAAAYAALAWFLVLVIFITPARLWHERRPPPPPPREPDPEPYTLAEISQLLDDEILPAGHGLVDEARSALDPDRTKRAAVQWLHDTKDELARYDSAWMRAFGNVNDLKEVRPNDGEAIAAHLEAKLRKLHNLLAT